MKNNIDKETAKLLLNGMKNLREFLLKSKPHIKKYRKCRIIHSEILDSMMDYMYEKHKYDLNEELSNSYDILYKEMRENVIKLEGIALDFSNDDEYYIFSNLTMYKNHKDIRFVIDDYISKNKFRNEDKKKMLYAMRDSVISFFKIIDVDSENAYVWLEDVVSGKKYKIVDISLSYPINKYNLYLFSRLITFDDISFLSGTMNFPKNIAKVNNYIKSCKVKNKSSLVKIIEVYDLYKEYGLSNKYNFVK